MEISCVAYRGTPEERKRINRDVDFVAMSYQIFQNDYDILKSVKAYFIIDETQILCNTQNVLYKMLMGGEISKRFPPPPGRIKPEIRKRVFTKINRGSSLLTGTPINKPEDSFGLITITNPEAYRNYNQFKRIHITSENPFGAATEYEQLDLLKENLLRNASMRYASDHLNLPPIVFKTILYDLHPEHKALYDKLVKEHMLELPDGRKIRVPQVMRLYHMCQEFVLNPEISGYKGEIVGLELLDLFVASVKRYIVSCNYVASNDKIMARYKVGGSYGKISSKDKRKYIEGLKTGEVDSITIHPKSGGYGLDLPFLQHVVIPELPITPRDFKQVCGRVWRQGQKETVFITIFIARKTIQHTLFKKFLDKDDLTRDIINAPQSLRNDLMTDVVSDIQQKTKGKLFAELKGE
jgi:SNF2 family DNA or RNA helicase